MEAEERHKTVRKTQKAIKTVLRERWYAWEDARKLAAQDPSVDLSGDGPAYQESGDGWVDVDNEEDLQNLQDGPTGQKEQSR